MPSRAVDRREKRKADLLRRVKAADTEALPLCAVPGCGRQPEARAGAGLSPTLCRYHRAFRSRHGSAWKGSYTGPQLKPYISAAERYLKAHADDFYVASALTGLAASLATAPGQRVVDLPRLSPTPKPSPRSPGSAKPACLPFAFLLSTRG